MFHNPMDYQNLEAELIKMFKSLVAASDVQIVKQTMDAGYKLHVSWDISQDMDPKTSVQNIAEFFHKFCEAFAERMSVGSYVGMKKQFYELQSSSFLKQSELQTQIVDLMRYKHAHELGAGKK